MSDADQKFSLLERGYQEGRGFNLDADRIRVDNQVVAATGRLPSIINFDFVACHFENQDFSGIDIYSCTFTDCVFVKVDFENLTFLDCAFSGCTFKQSEGIHIAFRDGKIERSTFADVSFEVAIFEGVSMSDVVWSAGFLQGYFDTCTLERVSFSELVVDATLRRCNVDRRAFEHLIYPESCVDFISTEASADETDAVASSLHGDPLAPYLVSQESARWVQLQELDAILSEGRSESDLQQFLESNRELIAITQEFGHHGLYVLSQVPLGNKHRADFMVACRNSMGFFWTAIELESPQHDVVKADGHFTATTNHALDQIEDWREYVRNNRASVQQIKSLGGDGLTQIEAEFKAWVIIGRDAERAHTYARRSRFLISRGNSHVQTWDGFRNRIAAALRKFNPK